MDTSAINHTQANTIRNYYKWHARLYQATRWTFLFGRDRIINALELPMFSEKTVLEVGCGTGHNLKKLARYYLNLQLIGVDISPHMLQVATRKMMRYSRRVLLLEKSYQPGNWKLPTRPDVVLFSYCLTMINPGCEDAIQRAHDDLVDGGLIAVVDFHDSPFKTFRRWMGFNHVNMDNHLLPTLKKHFTPVQLEVNQAYGGLWSYFIFIGKK